MNHPSIKESLKKIMVILDDTIEKVTVMNQLMKHLGCSLYERFKGYRRLRKLQKQKREVLTLLQQFT